MRYLHGGDVFDKQIVMDFSVNVNPLGMPEAVKRAAVQSIDFCGTYPDYDSRKLKAALAEHYGLAPEMFICGNGAAEVIYDAVRALSPGSGLVMAPTFSSYESALKACNAEVWIHYLKKENGFAADEDFAEDIYEKRPEAVFVCNPNNPTGRLMEEALMEKVLYACKCTGAALFIDECFLDFTDTASFVRHMADYQQLFIINAFTKLYAMPGLRSGYGICPDRSLLDRMEEIRQNWSLSWPAQEASAAALRENVYVRKTREYVREQRCFLEEALRQQRITVYEGDADFILVYSETDLYKRMLERGILIRDCSNFRGLSQGFYRIAVKSREDNLCFVQSLKEIMNG